MLQLRTIHPDTLELLKQIQKLPCATDTRLVGGTALALQYGHRMSVDLEIRLASPKDISAMKVNAIEGRGTKKDFIDIYALLQHYTLAEILDFYSQKYPEHSTFRALMSLTYFEDADAQMAPPMFDLPDWDTMKEYIRNSVNKFN